MLHNLKSLAVTAVKMMCATTVFLCLVFTVFTVGPSIESQYFPVVSKLEVLSVEPAPNGATKIRAAFRKIRECEYLGISWFVGNQADDFERVSVALLREPSDTSSPNRPVGYQRAGPWIIGASPAELKHNSFAHLSHRCHVFWTTTTEFYP